MKEDIEKFNKYVKKFDLKEKHIIGKFHHTYRVVELTNQIAISLNLNEQEIYVANLCGLYHDIARFKQWTEYNTFFDKDLFDHGNEGYKILLDEKFVNDKQNLQIIIQSTKNHNKYAIDKELDEYTALFCKIIRDADKIDIMKEQCNEIKENIIILKKELLDSIYNREICKNEYIENDTDHILRMLSWIFDFNFKYSFQYLKQNNVIKNKFNLLETYGETKEINKLKKFINEEIEKRI